MITLFIGTTNMPSMAVPIMAQLLEMDPRVSLPYWDSVLDQNLPNSRDSIIWSKEFMGDVDNISYVITEPYVKWRTIQVYNRVPPPQENDPEYKDYKRYLGCPINMGWSRDYPYTLEVAHASIHNYVGGDFADPVSLCPNLSRSI
uniref:Uncharacterized protein n=1 Tax=Acrobeloides nanus TaxID=290746 RepID=A0A914CDH0_9BILA